MDLVYKGAQLTIIAAAGEGEYYELPGVGLQRARQRIFETRQFTIAHGPSQPGFFLDALNGRKGSGHFKKSFFRVAGFSSTYRT